MNTLDTTFATTRRMLRVASLFLAALPLSAIATDAQPAAERTAEPTTEIKAAATAAPKVLMAGGDIAGCGVVFDIAKPEAATATATIALMRMRDGSSATATRFVVTASAPVGTITDAGVRVGDIDTQATFSKSASKPIPSHSSEVMAAPAFEAEALLSPIDGATLMRDMMIGGAQLSVAFDTGATETVLVSGPLPSSVRAAYLNCAGDLYRP